MTNCENVRMRKMIEQISTCGGHIVNKIEQKQSKKKRIERIDRKTQP